ncbi:MAG: RAD55 family ATPase [Candidatus Thermoplasmatota archaeon]|nr:RAD55 family ATPase [Candidatus Thermoplasmatota archaeon]
MVETEDAAPLLLDRRIPTWVNAFDNIIGGGLPAGSLVLLLGEVGSGHIEFAHTSSARLSLARDQPQMREMYLEKNYDDEIILPGKTVYISFSRSKEEVLREFRLSFATQYYEAFKKNLVFKDLSGLYFKRTPVPSSWIDQKPLFGNPQGNGSSLVESLVEFLDKEAPGAMVIIDSLTDLFLSNSINAQDIMYVLKGLQRASKKWGSLIYLLLTREVIEERQERIIADLCDGVLVFGWSMAEKRSWMRRYMYVAKFTGVLPHVDRHRVSRFLTDVRTNTGFVVANTERI